jgi:lipid-A-disaccharide synthase
MGYPGFLGMPNLLHGKGIIREFVQKNATADNLMNECTRLLEDELYREQVIKDVRECHQLLGTRGANKRVASEVLQILSRRPPLAADKLEHDTLGNPTPALA